jgi:1-deoxy-D-xylulose-5-phosphate reductoisomerase
MLKQIQQFHPELAVLTDPAAALELQHAEHGRTQILSGEEGLLAAATYAGVDTVLAAMVGYAGLKPTLTAIEHGKNIALANKETLVAAGSMVMAAVCKHQVSLTPVDSEHSAIFQSLRAGQKKEVRRLIITASGGPFRGMSKG